MGGKVLNAEATPVLTLGSGKSRSGSICRTCRGCTRLCAEHERADCPFCEYGSPPKREYVACPACSTPPVRVIPATRQVEPGPICEVAGRWGLRIEFTGELGEWQGYCWFHPVLGESEPAFESAEDCGLDGLNELRTALSRDIASVRGVVVGRVGHA